MNTGSGPERDIRHWNGRSWFWAVLCSLAIFSTIPAARGLQKFIYDTLGKEFFTYTVLFFIGCVFLILLYLFYARLNISSVSQYVWLIACAGVLVYVTLQLKEHPEEAFHLLEYGLLACLVFNALSHRVRDRTIYITTSLAVAFIGALDEFVQWVTPSRVWDYKDVGINMFAGTFFLLAIWKGVKPKLISQPVGRISVNVLVIAAMMNLVLFGICVSNTPDAVEKYTSIFNKLSWLRGEEVMTEFGHNNYDPGIGHIHSRFSIEEMEKIDRDRGEIYGTQVMQSINSTGLSPKSFSKDVYKALKAVYTRHTNLYLYQFLSHVSKRDHEYGDFMHTNDAESRLSAFRENQIVEKYFANTLEHSGLRWPSSRKEVLGDAETLPDRAYTSRTDPLITVISRKTALILIAITLALIWVLGELIKKRIDR